MSTPGGGVDLLGEGGLRAALADCSAPRTRSTAG
jgi:hypothetical protein